MIIYLLSWSSASVVSPSGFLTWGPPSSCPCSCFSRCAFRNSERRFSSPSGTGPWIVSVEEKSQMNKQAALWSQLPFKPAWWNMTYCDVSTRRDIREAALAYLFRCQPRCLLWFPLLLCFSLLTPLLCSYHSNKDWEIWGQHTNRDRRQYMSYHIPEAYEKAPDTCGVVCMRMLFIYHGTVLHFLWEAFFSSLGIVKKSMQM